MKLLNKISVILYLVIIIGAILLKLGTFDYIKYKLTDNDRNVPKELYVCFNELDELVGETDKTEFIRAKENELVEYHFGLGLYIRNYWIRNDGLNINLEKTFTEIGLKSADDMSGIIITSYHRYLNKKDIRFLEQVEEVNNFQVNKFEIIHGVLFVTIFQLLMSFMLLRWSYGKRKRLHHVIFIESNLVWIAVIACFINDNMNELIGSIIGILFIANICLLILSIICLGVYLVMNYTNRSSNKR